MEKLVKRLQSIFTKNEEIKKEKKVATPLPKTITAITFVLIFFDGMKFTMVYAYLPKLVQWFGINNADVGYYAGYIASSVFVGRFFFSFLWGYLSDVYGKKLTAILSATGIAVTSLLFGFSDNFWYALVTRFLQGCTTGLIPICQSIIKEHCDDTNIVLAMTIMPSAFSVGLLLGPSLSGFLAFPADVFPSLISSDSILGRYPALLPNLLVAAGLFITAIFAAIYLPKDKQVKKVKRKSYTSIPQQENPINNSMKDKIRNAKFTQVFQHKKSVICGILYMLIALVAAGMNEVFPLFAATAAKYGGLSFQPYDIGLALLFTAAALLVVQVMVLTKLTIKYGSRLVFIWCYVILAISSPFLPCLTAVQNTVLKWIGMIVYLVISRVSMVGGLLTLTVMLNNSVDDPSLTGAVNGFGIALSSIGRGFAPVVFGVVFAWSLTNVKSVNGNNRLHEFPFNQYFVFLILSVISISNAVIGYFLPESLNKSPQSFGKSKNSDIRYQEKNQEEKEEEEEEKELEMEDSI